MRFLTFLFLSLFAAVPSAFGAVPTEVRPGAVLRALDKITARVEEIEIKAETPTKFGTIIITIRTCRATPPEETPESAAFLDVTELRPGQEERAVFRGWMFASSPALSAMEHPVYDLWVVRCLDAPPVAQEPVPAPLSEEEAGSPPL